MSTWCAHVGALLDCKWKRPPLLFCGRWEVWFSGALATRAIGPASHPWDGSFCSFSAPCALQEEDFICKDTPPGPAFFSARALKGSTDVFFIKMRLPGENAHTRGFVIIFSLSKQAYYRRLPVQARNNLTWDGRWTVPFRVLTG